MRHFFPYIILIFSLFNGISAIASSSDSIKTPNQARAFFKNNLAEVDEYQNTIHALELIANDENTDSIGLYGATALNRYAWMLIGTGAQDNALPLFRRALEYCPPTDSVMYYDIMSGIGGIHLIQGNYEKALETISDALRFHTNANDSLGMVKDYFNIAILYLRKDKPSTALPYARKALKLAEESGNYDYQSHILGFISGMEPDLQRKDRLLNIAANINYTHNYNPLIPDNLLLKTKLYLASSQYNKAMEYAEKSMEASKKYNKTSTYIAALRLKAKIYAELKDYPQAYFNLNLAVEIEDAHLESEKKIQAKRGEYATRLLDWCDTNIVKRNGHYVVRRPMQPYIFILIITGLMAIGGFIYFLRKRAIEKKKLQVIQEKENLTAEIESLKEDKKNMRKKLNFLMYFYDNQNTLMERIRIMSKQGLSKEAEAANTLRKIGTYAASNMLDKRNDDFTAQQKEDNEAFIDRLQKAFPEVTDTEKKLALYLRADLSTHEICVITGNQPRSINMTRYRLRKSLHLGEGENLEQYLKSI